MASGKVTVVRIRRPPIAPLRLALIALVALVAGFVGAVTAGVATG